MKYIILVFLAFWSQNLFAQKYDLTITVSGMQSTDGEIQIGLYNNKESFPLEDKQYKLFFIDAKEFPGTYIIKDLPEGEYAVAIFHDKNSDKICNTNFLGIPKEDYGFSKNIKPRFSAPTFNDCKVDLKYNMSINIKLIEK
jgi:uncharacterized protein (DUF2141 family)